MKKLLMLACVLTLAMPAFAEQDKKPTAKYNGVVEKFDPLTKVLVVKKDDKLGEFTVTTTSEILLNNAKAETTAIAAGQKADVEFWMEGAKKMVKKLKVTGAATTAAKQ